MSPLPNMVPDVWTKRVLLLPMLSTGSMATVLSEEPQAAEETSVKKETGLTRRTLEREKLVKA